MSWRIILGAESPAQYPQNSHKPSLIGGSESFEDKILKDSISEAPKVVPSDIIDHFHERAGTLEFDGECPRDLADHVAQLETMHWWLHIQHPKILKEWMQLAGSIQPLPYSQNPQNHQK
jgi:hypothetical protein